MILIEVIYEYYPIELLNILYAHTLSEKINTPCSVLISLSMFHISMFVVKLLIFFHCRTNQTHCNTSLLSSQFFLSRLDTFAFLLTTFWIQTESVHTVNMVWSLLYLIQNITSSFSRWTFLGITKMLWQWQSYFLTKMQQIQV